MCVSLEARFVVQPDSQPDTYRLKRSIRWLFRKSSERDRRARHEPVSRRKRETTETGNRARKVSGTQGTHCIDLY